MQATPDGKYYVLAANEAPNELSYYVRYLCTRCGSYTSVWGTEMHEAFHTRLEEIENGVHELRIAAREGATDGAAEAVAELEPERIPWSEVFLPGGGGIPISRSEEEG